MSWIMGVATFQGSWLERATVPWDLSNQDLHNYKGNLHSEDVFEETGQIQMSQVFLIREFHCMCVRCGSGTADNV